MQKQMTENQVEEQKANVAAMRADVTVDTTQIGHKILRQVSLNPSNFIPASLACWLSSDSHKEPHLSISASPFILTETFSSCQRLLVTSQLTIWAVAGRTKPCNTVLACRDQQSGMTSIMNVQDVLTDKSVPKDALQGHKGGGAFATSSSCCCLASFPEAVQM